MIVGSKPLKSNHYLTFCPSIVILEEEKTLKALILQVFQGVIR